MEPMGGMVRIKPYVASERERMGETGEIHAWSEEAGNRACSLCCSE